MKENLKNFSDILAALSAVAAVLAVWGAFVSDIWLAPTQWVLVAILLVSYSVYLKH